MPLYDIQNKKTGEIKEVFCRYEEKEETLKKEGKDWEYIVHGINLAYQSSSVIKKTDSGWKDTLTRIKNASGKNNTINTGR